jgi:Zn-finger nucleic acid-binding protein
MEVDEVTIVEMELKYCERCGGLWVRLIGDEEVYCGACVPKMAEFPSPHRGSRGQLPEGHSDEFSGQCAELFAICCEGGNA